jgi:hypothetical protein
MLERTSRFVLEVLPYLLTALIAAVVLPQVLYSQADATKAAVTSNVSGRSSSGPATDPVSWRSDQSW